ncbi:MAG: amino acid ABC transporter permease [Actinomycetota bacterium]|nr:amino acid ABC transporter permease [Actinomycetota bacterium]
MSDSTEPIKAVPVRHPGRWIATAVILVLVAMFLNMAATNPNFSWDVVWEFLFNSQILKGVWATIWITIVAMIVGVALGVMFAVMRLSPNPVLSNVAMAYIWFFRGTPVLVQLIFWFNLAALVPMLSIGIPFGPTFASWDTNDVITPFMAALLGLALNEGAYMAEIARAGIQSVDEGQGEASSALGMSRAQTMRRIVLPQAMRVIIPPTGNEVISMLKTTSLVSVVALPELLYNTQQIYARTYQTIPLLIVASIWYLILTSILTVGQFYVERHYGRGSSSHIQQSFMQRWRKNLFKFHQTPPPPSSTLLDPNSGVR